MLDTVHCLTYVCWTQRSQELALLSFAVQWLVSHLQTYYYFLIDFVTCDAWVPVIDILNTAFKVDMSMSYTSLLYK
jgi:hypothetical protein